MFSRTKPTLTSHIRQFSTAVRKRIQDEGDWFYSSEWWDHGADSHTEFRALSDKGNGVVSVVSSPSSKPDKAYWGRMEDWLQKRYMDTCPGGEHYGDFRVTGYQWRTLRFNDDTRQSIAKVMAVYRESYPGSLYLMQQANCLAVPYVKSMISAGLTAINCNFDLKNAVVGKNKMNILCIGHGGGSIPLFLASQIQGALVHIVEIDPVVVLASIQAMGFPSFSVMTSSGERACTRPDPMDEVMWKGIHERLLLYESDAEEFILGDSNLYDIVFVDAYDGEDIFPHKLWDPYSPFLRALEKRLHPEHGTVVVNLHADSICDSDVSNPSTLTMLPMGRYVSKVCKAYKEVLIGTGSSHEREGSGVAFTVSVPWVCNTSLVVSKCAGNSFGNRNYDVILNALLSKSLDVENVLNLPFSCFQYIKRGFSLVN